VSRRSYPRGGGRLAATLSGRQPADCHHLLLPRSCRLRQRNKIGTFWGTLTATATSSAGPHLTRRRPSGTAIRGSRLRNPHHPRLALFNDPHRENLHSADCACIVYSLRWNIERVTHLHVLIRLPCKQHRLTAAENSPPKIVKSSTVKWMLCSPNRDLRRVSAALVLQYWPARRPTSASSSQMKAKNWPGWKITSRQSDTASPLWVDATFARAQSRSSIHDFQACATRHLYPDGFRFMVSGSLNRAAPAVRWGDTERSLHWRALVGVCLRRLPRDRHTDRRGGRSTPAPAEPTPSSACWPLARTQSASMSTRPFGHDDAAPRAQPQA
jgi:hypothetical protein